MKPSRQDTYVEKQIFHCLVFPFTLGSNDSVSTNLARNSTISKTLATLMGTWWKVALAVLLFRLPEEAGPRLNPSSYEVQRKDLGRSHSRTRLLRDS